MILLKKKNIFWAQLSQIVYDADDYQTGLIIQMDANLWASETLIKGDPNQQNINGKFLQNFSSENC